MYVLNFVKKLFLLLIMLNITVYDILLNNLQLVVAIIDPGVLKDLPEVDGSNEIFLKLQSMGAQYKLEPLVTHASVIWQRADVKHTVNSEMQVARQYSY